MAKYLITRSCGHEERVSIAGPYAQRERRLAYEAEKLCRECWQAKRDAEREAARKAAADWAAEQGLPELVGSPKQVAWAEAIRRDILADEDHVRGQLHKAPNEQERDRVVAILERIREEASASWWIDHRDRGLVEVIKDLARD